jgi:RNA polymerase sigma factor (sigma-70 family)
MGTRLLEERRARNLSQAAVSRAAGVRGSDLCGLERGRMSPVGATLNWVQDAWALSSFYRLEPEELFPEAANDRWDGLQKRREHVSSVDASSYMQAASASPDQLYERNELAEIVQCCVSSLNEREQMIVRHRFGIGDTEFLYLRELGERLGISGARAMQLEKKALQKLRRPRTVSPLRIFATNEDQDDLARRAKRARKEADARQHEIEKEYDEAHERQQLKNEQSRKINDLLIGLDDHDGTVYPIRLCPRCRDITDPRVGLAKHLVDIHGENQVPCPLCNRLVVFLLLHEHVKIAHGVSNVPLELVRTSMRSRPALVYNGAERFLRAEAAKYAADEEE